MPAISVIMAAYNNQATVKATITALKEQTFEDFEAIICDDGSTDGTGRIIKELIADDDRMKLVSFRREGVSCARNLGLSLANGEYITFVDGDDQPHKGWLQALEEGIRGVDLSVVGYRMFTPEGDLRFDTSEKKEAFKTARTMGAKDFMVALFSNQLYHQGYVWNKLFRRDVIMSQPRQLSFEYNISRNEDTLFVFQYLKRIKTVHCSCTPYFDYYPHSFPEHYERSWSTELLAFDQVIKELSKMSQKSPQVRDATYYAERKSFKETVKLFNEAYDANDPDAQWLSKRVCSLSQYRHEFSDEGEEFQQQIDRAIDNAECIREDK